MTKRATRSVVAALVSLSLVAAAVDRHRLHAFDITTGAALSRA